MRPSLWFAGLALSLLAVGPARAEIVKGVMSVTGAEMK
jgi:hypothetical protein